MTQRIAPDEDDEIVIRFNGEKVTEISVMRPTHLETIEAPFTKENIHGLPDFTTDE